jgi:ABC-2 type transport system ATP-binding protein
LCLTFLVLVAEDLGKRFPGRPNPAIEGIDLELRDGEVLGLVGLNGAGKTTTIRVAAGVALPTTGRVLVDGHDIVQDKVRASEGIGWVPELFPYEPAARARKLLTFYAGFHGLTGRAADDRATELLARVGLGAFEDARIRTYSQGMKKRFGLAQAMLAEPQNLLLDEVLNGLDPEGIAFVRHWVLDLRRQGKGVLLSSHILTELQALADRVAFVHGGRLIKVVDRADLAHAGKSIVHVTIQNLDPAAITYLGTVGAVLVEGDSVTVASPTADTATINAELVRRGYRVAEIRSEGSSLEAYFLELIHLSLPPPETRS